ncbi:MAG: hypothetical protein EPN57_00490 [Paraburkholderia sp.]|nr:MAG: hypothetical protein EPN57_00490 [Paraburkholderia sp.]
MNTGSAPESIEYRIRPGHGLTIHVRWIGTPAPGTDVKAPTEFCLNVASQHMVAQHSMVDFREDHWISVKPMKVAVENERCALFEGKFLERPECTGIPVQAARDIQRIRFEVGIA